MEFILKTVFDCNLNCKREKVHAIGDDLRAIFNHKSYSPLVEKINIDLYCFQTPFRLKYHSKPIYHDDKTAKVFPRDKKNDATFRMYHLLFVDIPLPDDFATCTEEDVVPMVGEAMVKYFTEVPLPVKIRKSFDKERFISDLQSFFANYNPENNPTVSGNDLA